MDGGFLVDVSRTHSSSYVTQVSHLGLPLSHFVLRRRHVQHAVSVLDGLGAVLGGGGDSAFNCDVWLQVSPS
jgi:hypothetical protein